MKIEMAFIIKGTLLGLSGGLSPGPLLTLVISESLRIGIKGGLKIAIAPIVTDAPIVIVTLYILAHAASIDLLVGWIAIMGGFFLLYMGYESITFKGADLQDAATDSGSFRKGILANFLNPSPYLFWFTIGASIMFEAIRSGILAAFLFIISFYIFLVGSKMILAVLVSKSRKFLKSNAYILTMRLLGVALMVFACLFFRTGIHHIRIF